MDEMHGRMRTVLLPLFETFGMPEPLAIWEDQIGSSTLTWLVEWPDFETRQSTWAKVGAAFAPIRLAAGSEFVTRTALTLIAPWPGAILDFKAADTACETLWHVQPRIGAGAGFVAACSTDVASCLTSLGATTVSGCNLIFGDLPQAAVFASWPNAAARAAAMVAVRSEQLSPALADVLVDGGPRLGDRGIWEVLDRAAYLPRWAMV